MSGKHRHFDLLKDPDVKRWYNNIKEGSQTTSDTSIRRLGLFCEFVGKSPNELLELNDKERNDLMVDFVSGFRNHGGTERSGTYLQAMVKPVRSWFAFNGIPVTRKVKISGSNSRPSLKNERVPTQEELRGILLAGDSRERLACAIMAFSGVRPQVLGNYKGTDGLRISDIADMEIKDDKVSFGKVPVRVVIRSELSKKDNEYFSFLGDEGAKYLKIYIEERIKEGEAIKPESPVITPSKRAIRDLAPFITTTNIGDLIRNTIRRSGLVQRPYVLRKYFDTQLLQAESKTGLKRDYRVFWMGHAGDMEHEYTLNHGILSEAIIEEMREQYAKASRFLETEVKRLSEEDKQSLEKTVTVTILQKIFGYSQEESEKLMQLSDEELQKELQKKLGNATDPESVKKRAMQDAREISKRKNKQVMIPIQYVDEYFNQGFEFVSAIGPDRAIMRLP